MNCFLSQNGMVDNAPENYCYPNFPKEDSEQGILPPTLFTTQEGTPAFSVSEQRGNSMDTRPMNPQRSQLDRPQDCTVLKQQNYCNPFNGFNGFLYPSQADISYAFREGVKQRNRFDLLDKKKEQSEHLQQLKEDHRQARELKTYSVLEDSDGNLLLQSRIPNKTAKFSEPIANVRRLRMKVCSSGNQKEELLYIIEWEGCNKPLVLCELIEKTVLKALQSRGIVIRLKKSMLDDAVRLLLEFLFKNAEHIRLPNHIGWEKDDKGAWFFTKPGNKTMKSLRKVAYGK